jgi:serine/threonine protein kinase
VKVIDYGLAWIKGDDKSRVQGTPEYMAPETAKRKLVNERTDIFNFGATMYRLATFRKLPSTVPEADMDIDPELWARQVKPVCEINAGAPKELGDLIHRCLTFDAHKRPESMRAVKSALEKLGEEQSVESSGPLEW